MSNGDKHQRDMLAAFNLQHLNYNDEDLKNYDIKGMKEDYPIFVKLEIAEMQKHKDGVKLNHSSTIGL